ncbi:hypothetical protein Leryth_027574 [Lithospermum erythrorhizon]|nr:hypothetical protein Leryth_027574 [Lithospermum erythrorhizon]
MVPCSKVSFSHLIFEHLGWVMVLRLNQLHYSTSTISSDQFVVVLLGWVMVLFSKVSFYHLIVVFQC